MKKCQRFLKKVSFHPNPVTRLYITLGYCAAGEFVNLFMLQAFCIPVWWAASLFVLFVMALVSLPFLKGIGLQISYVLLGGGIPACIYCILFMADPYFGFHPWYIPLAGYIIFIPLVLFFGGGLLSFIPFYLLWHVRQYWRGANVEARRLITIGWCVPCFILLMYLVPFGINLRYYNRVWAQSHSFSEIARKLRPNHFTERFLGVGIRYHTKMEYINDGQRPPLHDPFLNIGLWLFNTHGSEWRHGYSTVPGDYAEAIEQKEVVYQIVFPGKRARIDCECRSYLFFEAQWLLH
jgi:hypothetical protein